MLFDMAQVPVDGGQNVGCGLDEAREIFLPAHATKAFVESDRGDLGRSSVERRA